MNTTKNDGLDLPAALRRTTNTKGVTLSAGPVAQPVVATGAKTAPKRDRKAPRTTLAKEVKAAPAPKAAKAAKAPKTAKVVEQPVIDPATGLPIEKVRRSIVPMKFKARYSKHNGTCGDDMANELKAATTTRNADKREVLDVEALWSIARANGLEASIAKYVALNNGQKRMNVGNKLRGLLNQGTDVVIGKRRFKAEDHTPKQ